MALHPHIRFNDGQGLDYEDLAKSNQYLYAQLVESISLVCGGGLGGVFAMALSAAQGGDAYNVAPKQRQNLPEGKIFTPYPLNGVVVVDQSNSASPSNQFASVVNVGPGIIVTAQSSTTSGSVPVGLSVSTPMVHSLSAAVYDFAGALTSTNGSVSTYSNARWDTLAVKLDWATAASTSTDFKDGSTGALTTQSVPREMYVSASFSYQQGSVDSIGWASAIPSLPAGYAPLITRKRGSSDIGPNYNDNEFYYHAYPLTYRREILMPWDYNATPFGFVTGSSAVYPNDNHSDWTLSKFGTLSGDDSVYAIPRTMSPSSRLIAISVHLNGHGPKRMEMCWLDIPPSGGTSLVEMSLFGAGDGDLGNVNAVLTSTGSADGIYTISEADWSQGAEYPIPIWGNGRHYGPLFSDARFAYPTTVTFGHGLSQLAVRYIIDDSQYKIGATIFHYLE